MYRQFAGSQSWSVIQLRVALGSALGTAQGGFSLPFQNLDRQNRERQNYSTIYTRTITLTLTLILTFT